FRAMLRNRDEAHHDRIARARAMDFVEFCVIHLIAAVLEHDGRAGILDEGTMLSLLQPVLHALDLRPDAGARPRGQSAAPRAGACKRRSQRDNSRDASPPASISPPSSLP